MPNATLQNFLADIPEISLNRRYWFFRTEGGDFYESFYQGKFIAIGYNKITLKEIQDFIKTSSDPLGSLSERIKKAFGDEEKRPTHSASQLLKFTSDIKKGDIVLIPSESSYTIAFGEVTSSSVYLKTTEPDICSYSKRKSVRWLKTLRRDQLDPNLFRLMFSHHTITEADNYAKYIDSIIGNFYVKNDQAHLVLKVETTKDIKARDLFEMGTVLLDLVDEYFEEENLQSTANDVNVKIAVQSPGFIELTGYNITAILVAGLLIVGLAGGGFAFKYKKDVTSSLKSDGIIDKIGKFLNGKSNRKAKKDLLEKHCKNLEIKDPDDLVKILKELNK